ncbi:hypothetical protein C3L33_15239, partial [Rhododendron williamsianum]
MAFSFSPLLIPLLLLLLHHLTTASSPLPYSLSPNFTASYLELDNNSNYGAFLATGPFSAAMTKTSYLAVVHTASDTIVWSASRSSFIPYINVTIRLTASGIYIEDNGGKFVWSTPPFSSLVSLLSCRSLEIWSCSTGLIGRYGKVLITPPTLFLSDNGYLSDNRWSVLYPTKTCRWAITGSLSLTMGRRRGDDLEWVDLLDVVNGRKGLQVVIQLTLNVSQFRIARLEYDGRFSIMTFNSKNWVEEFGAPDDYCGIPYICGTIGVCLSATPLICSCPLGFHFNDQTSSVCSPVDDSYSLPSACNASGNGDSNVSTSYLELGYGMDYFLNDFSKPRARGVNLSSCLPVRFGFKELVAAIENFRAKIGSGGFGTVNKGTLPDESAVAVKKITVWALRERENSARRLL